MKIVIRRSEYRIRLVVFCFSLFVALMLFQTSYKNLGTLTASGTLLLTLVAYFLQGKGLRGRIVLNVPVCALTVFLLYSVLITELYNTRPSGYIRYIAQIVLCLLLFSVDLNWREHNYLKNLFIGAVVVYAILIMQSYTVNYREGYSHSDVILFNTKLDPNFVGFPLVAATTLLLDNILMNRKRVLSLILYALVAGTIVYTASRGSTVSLVCANMLVYITFLFQKNFSTGRRILFIVLPLLVIVLLMQLFSYLLPAEWARITTYGENADNGRLALWLRVLSIFWEAPVFGRGLGYWYNTYGYAVHNTYLQVLCGTGLVGFILACVAVFYMLNKARKADKILFCMLAGALVQSMFLDALDNRCLWIILSWIAMLPSGKRCIAKGNAHVLSQVPQKAAR